MHVFSYMCVEHKPCMSNTVADAHLSDRAPWGEQQSLASFPLVLQMLQLQMHFNWKHESMEQKCSSLRAQTCSFCMAGSSQRTVQMRAFLKGCRCGCALLQKIGKRRTVMSCCAPFHRIVRVKCESINDFGLWKLISSGSIQSPVRGQPHSTLCTDWSVSWLHCVWLLRFLLCVYQKVHSRPILSCLCKMTLADH